MSDTQEAWCDSLYFNRNTSDIEMLGNVQLNDTTRNVYALAGRLDYVDCLLIAEGLSPSTEIISFDRKLLNEMKRRMHVSVQE